MRCCRGGREDRQLARGDRLGAGEGRSGGGFLRQRALGGGACGLVSSARSTSPSPATATGVVGMARLLSDGVCNAYLVDVWTHVGLPPPGHRVGDGRAGSSEAVPGQHVGLQTDDARRALRLARLPGAARVLVARLRPLARQRRQPLSAGRDEPVLRVATVDDEAAVERLMKESAAILFPRFYDELRAASAVRYVAQADPLLLRDGTYFVLESGDEMVACGGWSRRDRMYTGSGDGADDARALDPATEAGQGAGDVRARPTGRGGASAAGFSRRARPPPAPRASATSRSWRRCPACRCTSRSASSRSTSSRSSCRTASGSTASR